MQVRGLKITIHIPISNGFGALKDEEIGQVAMCFNNFNT